MAKKTPSQAKILHTSEQLMAQATGHGRRESAAMVNALRWAELNDQTLERNDKIIRGRFRVDLDTPPEMNNRKN